MESDVYMERLERKEAKRLGKITYFTGQPCKKGHTAYRYVKNGGCSECVKAANGVTSEPDCQERKEAKASLVTVRVRIHDVDREFVAASVWALALMRWPYLTQGDVDPKKLPQDRQAGTGLYMFNCHEEDIAAVREIAAAAVRSHALDIEARRLEILKGLQVK